MTQKYKMYKKIEMLLFPFLLPMFLTILLVKMIDGMNYYIEQIFFLNVTFLLLLSLLTSNINGKNRNIGKYIKVLYGFLFSILIIFIIFSIFYNWNKPTSRYLRCIDKEIIKNGKGLSNMSHEEIGAMADDCSKKTKTKKRVAIK
jgi:hypothetical protein